MSLFFKNIFARYLNKLGPLLMTFQPVKVDFIPKNRFSQIKGPYLRYLEHFDENQGQYGKFSLFFIISQNKNLILIPNFQAKFIYVQQLIFQVSHEFHQITRITPGIRRNPPGHFMFFKLRRRCLKNYFLRKRLDQIMDPHGMLCIINIWGKISTSCGTN